MPFDLLIRGAQIVLPGQVARSDVAVEGGTIVEVGPQLKGSAPEMIDAAGLHLFPGAVDVHVHFNEPGRTDWEGAATGSAALAAGGGTCFCDMPLNSSPPTLDGPSFDLKRKALEAASLVDFGLWGGLTPTNLDRLDELADRGVVGLKAFMCPSGIDDFLWSDEETLGRGMEIAARHGLLVGVHAEDPTITGELAQTARANGTTSVCNYLESRPIAAEVKAIETAIRLAEQTGCSLHVVHVSSGAGVAAVVAARSRGTAVTCETCPHYLILTGDDMKRIGAAAKCAPPLRDFGELERLWDALERDDILLVASDHSPSPWPLKQGHNFFGIWGGIAGVQTTLGLLLAEGHVKRGLPLEKIAALATTRPAARFGLARKGRLEVGMDADFTLIDLRTPTTVQLDDLLYRHRISPFAGRALGGTVKRTFVRGCPVFVEGKIVASGGGRFVRPALATEARP
jgi:allantoinase